jgi:predicted enzyme related to lactoylglutathione lyase
VLTVADIERSLAHYAGLGFATAFRDGNRWASLESAGWNIALASFDEQMPVTSIMIKVPDVEVALAQAVGVGARVEQSAMRGRHEIRAAFSDPDGHVFYVYSTAQAAEAGQR